MLFMDTAIAEVVDRHVVPHVKNYFQRSSPGCGPSGPFILGVTGLQGSGKSTWASKMVELLSTYYHYNAINLSLDDLYHDHAHLVAIASENPANKLLQTRGQPGTHDELLAAKFFASLYYGNIGDKKKLEQEQVLIPSFDKSKFGGEGDRSAIEKWKRISKSPKIDIVVFEGWCLGFQPLLPDQLHEKWELAKRQCSSRVQRKRNTTAEFTTSTLQDHQFESLEYINKNLGRYCASFMGPQHLDYLVHLDTQDLQNVYEWRNQQEHALRMKGQGAMSDETVQAFVRGYMPAYELYLDRLREDFFRNENRNLDGEVRCSKGHVRVLLDRERRITAILPLS